MLQLKDFFLRPLRAASFLSADFFDPRLLRGDPPRLQPFDPIEKQSPGQQTVYGLRAVLLAFNGKARGQVNEIDAGCRFVDILTAGS